jgi:hypothetical protein
MLSGHWLSRISIVIILCIYLLFPSGLSTTDAWYYAASIKHCGEIFQPHHLLYNSLGLVFSWLPSIAGIDILSSMKVLNALFAFFVLLVIQQILYKFGISERQIVLISCLTGFSFSMLRFATENETYIVPLFFALLASLNWVNFMKEKKVRFSLHAGIYASLAVLFHQIYIFWWTGLLIAFLFEKGRRAVLLYFVVSMMGPVVYLIVILTTVGTGWHDMLYFILGAFRGNATLGISLQGLFLSFINLLRSFIQIHGYIYNMVKDNTLFAIPGIISVTFVLLAFFKVPGRIRANVSQKFCTIHILIIVLQFIFAVLSFGNAEFMVMIPVLVIILVPFYTINNEKFLIRIAIALVVWNISYGLFPLHFRSQAPEQFLCENVLEEKNIIIIASDDNLLKSMLYYKTGDNNIKNIIKSPASFDLRGCSQSILEGVIDSALSKGTKILTNCMDEEAISRQSIIEGNQNRTFFSNYETIIIRSWDQSTGKRSIYQVKKKT